MSRSVIIVLAFAAVIVHSYEVATDSGESTGCKPKCRPDQHYKKCGTACPPTCDNPNPAACTLQCKVGCQCKPGLLTQSDGSCIKPSECPKKCGPNQVFTSCGTACPPTCDNPNPSICTEQCKVGCQCKPGLLTQSDGSCIKPSECPKKCGPNQVFNSCGTACPATCDNPNPSICTKQCKIGCECKPGFLMQPDGSCIKPSECPKKCGPNQVFTSCGTACPPTCDNPKPSICTLQCKVGCQCKPGLLTQSDGSCIKPSECPKKCGPNQVFNSCGTACPATCDNPKPSICTKQCKIGCECKPGFLMQADGSCIEPSQCPKICRPDQVFESCGTACPPTCDNPKPSICTLQCKVGCQCKPGLLTQSDGSCIKPSECPKKCGPNQVFNSCGTACPATCDNPKPSICTKQCKIGCECKPGFLMQADGSCIEPSQCPKICRPDQVFESCGTACPPTCDNPKPSICTLQCKVGCQCKPGLLTQSDGSCIKPSECPKKCGPNQVFNSCGTACPATCDNPKPSICTKQCKIGCECKPGFLMQADGSCIEPSQCPKICRTDQVFESCGTACPPTCDNPKPWICTLQCKVGCQCKPGLLTQSDGSCIKPSECPKKCGPNQVFNSCGTACPATCDNPKPSICTKQCKIGCECKPGFLMQADGSCIEPSQCPKICRPDQVFESCGTACPPTCDNPKPSICTLQCKVGCQCKPGLLTQSDGSCIKPSECPKKCGPNQVFNSCGTACPATCDNPKPSICTKQCKIGCECKPGFLMQADGSCIEPSQCPKICRPDQVFESCGTACPPTCDNPKPSICTLQCKVGCQCKPGLLTQSDGSCIKPSECPKKCGPNQVFNSCGTACPATCDNPKPSICTKQCKIGCECKPGFLMQADGSCIEPSQCPKICRPDQVFESCGTACPPTCDNPKPSICTLQCKVGCQCKPGLLTQSDGSCIKPSECPKKCGPNQVFNSCGTACPATCDNPKPSICTKQCKIGCECKPGFLMQADGSCIEPSQCPKICRPDQVFESCGTACPPTCDNPKPSICTLQCKVGCQCKPGLLTQSNGSCIKPSECPKKCGPNQVFNSCGTACPATCDNPKPSICTKQCKIGCECKPGFLMQADGSCIEPSQCPKICRTDQVFESCGTACPPTCDNPKPWICTLQCKVGCQCKPGLLTQSDGSCIKPSECPKKCGPNQVFNSCGTACPATCDNPKPSICTKQCKIGCECKPGFLMQADGSCIEPSQCPKICRPDQVFESCGTACPPTCDNPKPSICTLQCKVGCQCKPGLLTQSDGSCIKPSECPKKCGPNQVFNSCGTACPATCDNPKPSICTKQCKIGCECKPGFLMQADGTCIEPSQCPKICRPDQVFESCGTACPPTCDNPKPSICTLQCKVGCQCKPGLLTQSDGSCIKPSECPKKCGPNQVFNSCGTACPPTCDNPKPSICTLQCKVGCQCKPGLLTQSDGSCIKPSECPKKCGPNQVFNSCGTACPATCDNPKPSICTKQCKSGCECKPGFLMQADGSCIEPSQCPKICRPDQVFESCGTACPPTCDNPKPSICTLQCKVGCQCKPGLLTQSDGSCIKPSECPKKCGPNQVFNSCGTACPATCDNPKPSICTKQCKIGCECKPGFLMQADGSCIEPSQCPKICRPDQVFKRCCTACPPTCDNPNPSVCSTKQCKMGCECKPGLLTLPDGSCIDPSDCPQVD